MSDLTQLWMKLGADFESVLPKSVIYSTNHIPLQKWEYLIRIVGLPPELIFRNITGSIITLWSMPRKIITHTYTQAHTHTILHPLPPNTHYIHTHRHVRTYLITTHTHTHRGTSTHHITHIGTHTYRHIYTSATIRHIPPTSHTDTPYLPPPLQWQLLQNFGVSLLLFELMQSCTKFSKTQWSTKVHFQCALVSSTIFLSQNNHSSQLLHCGKSEQVGGGV